MAVETGFGKLGCAGLLAAVLVTVFATWPASAARAFSSPASYMDGVDVGGGAGRWFTGSSADGYGCDACHEGAPGAELAVTGLPLTGFVPGTAYEVSVIWPPVVQHVALVAEFTDELRQGAGTLELPRFDPATPPFERCSGEEDGFPSSEVLAGEAGRQFVTVIDCGARMLRFKWTAPALAPPSGRIWFNVGFVASNDDALPGGDGVTLVGTPLPLSGTTLATRTVTQGSCSAAGGAGRGASPCMAAALALLLPAFALRRRRRKDLETERGLMVGRP